MKRRSLALALLIPLLSSGAAASDPALDYAREELAKYARALTAKPLEDGLVTVGVDSSLGEQTFRLRERDGRLSISGVDGQAALWGVYTYLEKHCGVRWYAAWCEKVPRLGALPVPRGLDVTEKPAFRMRTALWYDAMHNPDFAARMKLNGDQTDLEPRHGGERFRFGRRLPSSHTMNDLVDPLKYFKDHPEYFALWNGKRDWDEHCFTNPDVFRITLAGVLERMRADPHARYYGVSQNDTDTHCCCEECERINAEEGTKGGTLIRFVNAIAAEVEKEFPDAVIETLAYRYSAKPPKKTKARKNVMPCFCTFTCEFANSIPESPHPANRSIAADVAQWKKMLTCEDLYVWDYTTCFPNYLMPFPNVYTLQKNCRFFRDAGVTCLFEQGGCQGRHAEFAELKTWLLAKWLWNPEEDAETLIDDFMNGYYGKAGPIVRKYFDRTQALAKTFDPLKNPLRINVDPRVTVDPRSVGISQEFVDEGERLFQAALAAVADDPATWWNVRRTALTIDYLRARRENSAPHAKALLEAMDRVAAEGRGPIRLSNSDGSKDRKMIRDFLTVVADDAKRPLAASVFSDYWRKIAVNPEPKAVFTLDPTLSKSGNDAYAVKERGGTLVFTGANGRSLLYAVYDFFRRRGCSWFWDGDVLPAKGAVDVAGTDFREESRFEYRGIRYFAHRGLKRFQAEHWGLEDWKKEIDWCVKNRLNVMMLRIGMDDVWQRAFPDVVPYPDPAKPVPEALTGYDNRSLFWPLQHRGALRKALSDYARERGLEIPTDFGTVSHWYSRTPKAYLEKVKPPFLPQASKDYSEDTGKVWDVRDPKWYEEYWKLTEAQLAAGYGGDRLLHTIGFGERRVFADRARNHAFKIDVNTNLVALALRHRPDAKVLLAGWDFFYSWTPSEVRALIPHLDPKTTIIWDYEGDTVHDEPISGETGEENRRNFTNWGVVGRFPYTFSMFLCYEMALDVRANYPLIEKRFAVAKDDPMCRGFLLWPESAHTDAFAMRYFADNAWRPDDRPLAEQLAAFCRDRYGRSAAAMEKLWLDVLPIARTLGWWGNCATALTGFPGHEPKVAPEALGAAPRIFRGLAALDLDDPVVRRDAIDLARTVLDRLLCTDRHRGDVRLWRLFADVLEQHSDYSLNDSLDALAKDGPLANPDFGRVLLDNCANSYCRSHQYELVRRWYLPFVEGGELTAERCEELRRKLLATPLREMRPRAERSGRRLRELFESFRSAVRS